MASLDQVPAGLDSSNAKLVYLYLKTVDTAIIDDLKTLSTVV